MLIACIVAKAYVGVTPAGGAETYLHDTLKFLVEQGHQVDVFLNAKTKRVEGQGVNVSQMTTDHTAMEAAVRECDFIITHLDGTPLAQSLASRFKKPLVQIVHNTNEYTEVFLAYGVDLAIYNSEWVSEYHETLKKGPMTHYWSEKGRVSLQVRRQTKWESFILPPPIHLHDYAIESQWVERGTGFITLVNPCDNKGQHIFYELARRCPDLGFLAVVGGYQPSKQRFVDLPNVTKHEHVQDMRTVF